MEDAPRLPKWAQRAQWRSGSFGVSSPSVFRRLGPVRPYVREPVADPPLAGMIFGCTTKTYHECMRLQLFGLPLNNKSQVLRVVPGSKLFLFNFRVKEMSGIFEATSYGGLSIMPGAFANFGSFPAQVKIRCIDECPNLPEDVFKEAIRENYIDRHKFTYELTTSQVQRLMDLFRREAHLCGLHSQTVQSNQISTQPDLQRPQRETKLKKKHKKRQKVGEGETSVGIVQSSAEGGLVMSKASPSALLPPTPAVTVSPGAPNCLAESCVRKSINDQCNDPSHSTDSSGIKEVKPETKNSCQQSAVQSLERTAESTAIAFMTDCLAPTAKTIDTSASSALQKVPEGLPCGSCNVVIVQEAEMSPVCTGVESTVSAVGGLSDKKKLSLVEKAGLALEIGGTLGMGKETAVLASDDKMVTEVALSWATSQILEGLRGELGNVGAIKSEEKRFLSPQVTIDRQHSLEDDEQEKGMERKLQPSVSVMVQGLPSPKASAPDTTLEADKLQHRSTESKKLLSSKLVLAASEVPTLPAGEWSARTVESTSNAFTGDSLAPTARTHTLASSAILDAAENLLLAVSMESEGISWGLEERKIAAGRGGSEEFEVAVSVSGSGSTVMKSSLPVAMDRQCSLEDIALKQVEQQERRPEIEIESSGFVMLEESPTIGVPDPTLEVEELHHNLTESKDMTSSGPVLTALDVGSLPAVECVVRPVGSTSKAFTGDSLASTVTTPRKSASSFVQKMPENLAHGLHNADVGLEAEMPIVSMGVEAKGSAVRFTDKENLRLVEKAGLALEMGGRLGLEKDTAVLASNDKMVTEVAYSWATSQILEGLGGQLGTLHALKIEVGSVGVEGRNLQAGPCCQEELELEVYAGIGECMATNPSLQVTVDRQHSLEDDGAVKLVNQEEKGDERKVQPSVSVTVQGPPISKAGAPDTTLLGLEKDTAVLVSNDKMVTEVAYSWATSQILEGLGGELGNLHALKIEVGSVGMEGRNLQAGPCCQEELELEVYAGIGECMATNPSLQVTVDRQHSLEDDGAMKLVNQEEKGDERKVQPSVSVTVRPPISKAGAPDTTLEAENRPTESSGLVSSELILAESDALTLPVVECLARTVESTSNAFTGDSWALTATDVSASCATHNVAENIGLCSAAAGCEGIPLGLQEGKVHVGCCVTEELEVAVSLSDVVLKPSIPVAVDRQHSLEDDIASKLVEQQEKRNESELESSCFVMVEESPTTKAGVPDFTLEIEELPTDSKAVASSELVLAASDVPTLPEVECSARTLESLTATNACKSSSSFLQKMQENLAVGLHNAATGLEAEMSLLSRGLEAKWATVRSTDDENVGLVEKAETGERLGMAIEPTVLASNDKMLTEVALSWATSQILEEIGGELGNLGVLKREEKGLLGLERMNIEGQPCGQEELELDVSAVVGESVLLNPLLQATVDNQHSPEDDGAEQLVTEEKGEDRKLQSPTTCMVQGPPIPKASAPGTTVEDEQLHHRSTETLPIHAASVVQSLPAGGWPVRNAESTSSAFTGVSLAPAATIHTSASCAIQNMAENLIIGVCMESEEVLLSLEDRKVDAGGSMVMKPSPPVAVGRKHSLEDCIASKLVEHQEARLDSEVESSCFVMLKEYPATKSGVLYPTLEVEESQQNPTGSKDVASRPEFAASDVQTITTVECLARTVESISNAFTGDSLAPTATTHTSAPSAIHDVAENMIVGVCMESEEELFSLDDRKVDNGCCGGYELEVAVSVSGGGSILMQPSPPNALEDDIDVKLVEHQERRHESELESSCFVVVKESPTTKAGVPDCTLDVEEQQQNPTENKDVTSSGAVLTVSDVPTLPAVECSAGTLESVTATTACKSASSFLQKTPEILEIGLHNAATDLEAEMSLVSTGLETEWAAVRSTDIENLGHVEKAETRERLGMAKDTTVLASTDKMLTEVALSWATSQIMEGLEGELGNLGVLKREEKGVLGLQRRNIEGQRCGQEAAGVGESMLLNPLLQATVDSQHSLEDDGAMQLVHLEDKGEDRQLQSPTTCMVQGPPIPKASVPGTTVEDEQLHHRSTETLPIHAASAVQSLPAGGWPVRTAESTSNASTGVSLAPAATIHTSASCAIQNMAENLIFGVCMESEEELLSLEDRKEDAGCLGAEEFKVAVSVSGGGSIVTIDPPLPVAVGRKHSLEDRIVSKLVEHQETRLDSEVESSCFVTLKESPATKSDVLYPTLEVKESQQSPTESKDVASSGPEFAASDVQTITTVECLARTVESTSNAFTAPTATTHTSASSANHNVAENMRVGVCMESEEVSLGLEDRKVEVACLGAEEFEVAVSVSGGGSMVMKPSPLVAVDRNHSLEDDSASRLVEHQERRHETEVESSCFVMLEESPTTKSGVLYPTLEVEESQQNPTGSKDVASSRPEFSASDVQTITTVECLARTVESTSNAFTGESLAPTATTHTSASSANHNVAENMIVGVCMESEEVSLSVEDRKVDSGCCGGHESEVAVSVSGGESIVMQPSPPNALDRQHNLEDDIDLKLVEHQERRHESELESSCFVVVKESPTTKAGVPDCTLDVEEQQQNPTQSKDVASSGAVLMVSDVPTLPAVEGWAGTLESATATAACKSASSFLKKMPEILEIGLINVATGLEAEMSIVSTGSEAKWAPVRSTDKENLGHVETAETRESLFMAKETTIVASTDKMLTEVALSWAASQILEGLEGELGNLGVLKREEKGVLGLQRRNIEGQRCGQEAAGVGESMLLNALLQATVDSQHSLADDGAMQLVHQEDKGEDRKLQSPTTCMVQGPPIPTASAPGTTVEDERLQHRHTRTKDLLSSLPILAASRVQSLPAGGWPLRTAESTSSAFTGASLAPVATIHTSASCAIPNMAENLIIEVCMESEEVLLSLEDRKVDAGCLGAEEFEDGVSVSGGGSMVMKPSSPVAVDRKHSLEDHIDSKLVEHQERRHDSERESSCCVMLKESPTAKSGVPYPTLEVEESQQNPTESKSVASPGPVFAASDILTLTTVECLARTVESTANAFTGDGLAPTATTHTSTSLAIHIVAENMMVGVCMESEEVSLGLEDRKVDVGCLGAEEFEVAVSVIGGQSMVMKPSSPGPVDRKQYSLDDDIASKLVEHQERRHESELESSCFVVVKESPTTKAGVPDFTPDVEEEQQNPTESKGVASFGAVLTVSDVATLPAVECSVGTLESPTATMDCKSASPFLQKMPENLAIGLHNATTGLGSEMSFVSTGLEAKWTAVRSTDKENLGQLEKAEMGERMGMAKETTVIVSHDKMLTEAALSWATSQILDGLEGELGNPGMLKREENGLLSLERRKIEGQPCGHEDLELEVSAGVGELVLLNPLLQATVDSQHSLEDDDAMQLVYNQEEKGEDRKLQSSITCMVQGPPIHKASGTTLEAENFHRPMESEDLLSNSLLALAPSVVPTLPAGGWPVRTVESTSGVFTGIRLAPTATTHTSASSAIHIVAENLIPGVCMESEEVLLGLEDRKVGAGCLGPEEFEIGVSISGGGSMVMKPSPPVAVDRKHSLEDLIASKLVEHQDKRQETELESSCSVMLKESQTTKSGVPACSTLEVEESQQSPTESKNVASPVPVFAASDVLTLTCLARTVESTSNAFTGDSMAPTATTHTSASSASHNVVENMIVAVCMESEEVSLGMEDSKVEAGCRGGDELEVASSGSGGGSIVMQPSPPDAVDRQHNLEDDIDVKLIEHQERRHESELESSFFVMFKESPATKAGVPDFCLDVEELQQNPTDKETTFLATNDKMLTELESSCSVRLKESPATKSGVLYPTLEAEESQQSPTESKDVVSFGPECAASDGLTITTIECLARPIKSTANAFTGDGLAPTATTHTSTSLAIHNVAENMMVGVCMESEEVSLGLEDRKVDVGCLGAEEFEVAVSVIGGQSMVMKPSSPGPVDRKQYSLDDDIASKLVEHQERRHESELESSCFVVVEESPPTKAGVPDFTPDVEEEQQTSTESKGVASSVAVLAVSDVPRTLPAVECSVGTLESPTATAACKPATGLEAEMSLVSTGSEAKLVAVRSTDNENPGHVEKAETGERLGMAKETTVVASNDTMLTEVALSWATSQFLEGLEGELGNLQVLKREEREVLGLERSIEGQPCGQEKLELEVCAGVGESMVMNPSLQATVDSHRRLEDDGVKQLVNQEEKGEDRKLQSSITFLQVQGPPIHNASAPGTTLEAEKLHSSKELLCSLPVFAPSVIATLPAGLCLVRTVESTSSAFTGVSLPPTATIHTLASSAIHNVAENLITGVCMESEEVLVDLEDRKVEVGCLGAEEFEVAVSVTGGRSILIKPSPPLAGDRQQGLEDEIGLKQVEHQKRRLESELESSCFVVVNESPTTKAGVPDFTPEVKELQHNSPDSKEVASFGLNVLAVADIATLPAVESSVRTVESTSYQFTGDRLAQPATTALKSASSFVQKMPENLALGLHDAAVVLETAMSLVSTGLEDKGAAVKVADKLLADLAREVGDNSGLKTEPTVPASNGTRPVTHATEMLPSDTSQIGQEVVGSEMTAMKREKEAALVLEESKVADGPCGHREVGGGGESVVMRVSLAVGVERQQSVKDDGVISLVDQQDRTKRRELESSLCIVVQESPTSKASAPADMAQFADNVVSCKVGKRQREALEIGGNLGLEVEPTVLASNETLVTHVSEILPSDTSEIGHEVICEVKAETVVMKRYLPVGVCRQHSMEDEGVMNVVHQQDRREARELESSVCIEVQQSPTSKASAPADMVQFVDNVVKCRPSTRQREALETESNLGLEAEPAVPSSDEKLVSHTAQILPLDTSQIGQEVISSEVTAIKKGLEGSKVADELCCHGMVGDGGESVVMKISLPVGESQHSLEDEGVMNSVNQQEKRESMELESSLSIKVQQSPTSEVSAPADMADNVVSCRPGKRHREALETGENLGLEATPAVPASDDKLVNCGTEILPLDTCQIGQEVICSEVTVMKREKEAALGLEENKVEDGPCVRGGVGDGGESVVMKISLPAGVERQHSLEDEGVMCQVDQQEMRGTRESESSLCIRVQESPTSKASAPAVMALFADNVASCRLGKRQREGLEIRENLGLVAEPAVPASDEKLVTHAIPPLDTSHIGQEVMSSQVTAMKREKELALGLEEISKVEDGPCCLGGVGDVGGSVLVLSVQVGVERQSSLEDDGIMSLVVDQHERRESRELESSLSIMVQESPTSKASATADMGQFADGVVSCRLAKRLREALEIGTNLGLEVEPAVQASDDKLVTNAAEILPLETCQIGQEVICSEVTPMKTDKKASLGLEESQVEDGPYGGGEVGDGGESVVMQLSLPVGVENQHSVQDKGVTNLVDQQERTETRELESSCSNMVQQSPTSKASAPVDMAQLADNVVSCRSGKRQREALEIGGTLEAEPTVRTSNGKIVTHATEILPLDNSEIGQEMICSGVMAMKREKEASLGLQEIKVQDGPCSGGEVGDGGVSQIGQEVICSEVTAVKRDMEASLGVEESKVEDAPCGLMEVDDSGESVVMNISLLVGVERHHSLEDEGVMNLVDQQEKRERRELGFSLSSMIQQSPTSKASAPADMAQFADNHVVSWKPGKRQREAVEIVANFGLEAKHAVPASNTGTLVTHANEIPPSGNCQIGQESICSEETAMKIEMKASLVVEESKVQDGLGGLGKVHDGGEAVVMKTLPVGMDRPQSLEDERAMNLVHQQDRREIPELESVLCIKVQESPTSKASAPADTVQFVDNVVSCRPDKRQREALEIGANLGLEAEPTVPASNHASEICHPSDTSQIGQEVICCEVTPMKREKEVSLGVEESKVLDGHCGGREVGGGGESMVMKISLPIGVERHHSLEDEGVMNPVHQQERIQAWELDSSISNIVQQSPTSKACALGDMAQYNVVSLRPGKRPREAVEIGANLGLEAEPAVLASSQKLVTHATEILPSDTCQIGQEVFCGEVMKREEEAALGLEERNVEDGPCNGREVGDVGESVVMNISIAVEVERHHSLVNEGVINLVNQEERGERRELQSSLSDLVQQSTTSKDSAPADLADDVVSGRPGKRQREAQEIGLNLGLEEESAVSASNGKLVTHATEAFPLDTCQIGQEVICSEVTTVKREMEASLSCVEQSKVEDGPIRGGVVGDGGESVVMKLSVPVRMERHHSLEVEGFMNLVHQQERRETRELEALESSLSNVVQQSPTPKVNAPAGLAHLADNVSSCRPCKRQREALEIGANLGLEVSPASNGTYATEILPLDTSQIRQEVCSSEVTEMKREKKSSLGVEESKVEDGPCGRKEVSDGGGPVVMKLCLPVGVEMQQDEGVLNLVNKQERRESRELESSLCNMVQQSPISKASVPADMAHSADNVVSWRPGKRQREAVETGADWGLEAEPVVQASDEKLVTYAAEILPLDMSLVSCSKVTAMKREKETALVLEESKVDDGPCGHGEVGDASDAVVTKISLPLGVEWQHSVEHVGVMNLVHQQDRETMELESSLSTMVQQSPTSKASAPAADNVVSCRLGKRERDNVPTSPKKRNNGLAFRPGSNVFVTRFPDDGGSCLASTVTEGSDTGPADRAEDYMEISLTNVEEEGKRKPESLVVDKTSQEQQNLLQPPVDGGSKRDITPWKLLDKHY